MQGRVAVDEAWRARSGSRSVRVVFAVHVAAWVCSDSRCRVRELLGASIVKNGSKMYVCVRQAWEDSVYFSQVVVGTSRLDTVEQIGHDPTGMLQWWQWKRRVKEGTPHSGLDRFFRAARVRRGFNHRQ